MVNPKELPRVLGGTVACRSAWVDAAAISPFDRRGVVEDGVRLRPINESDLALIVRFEWDLDAIGEFDWFGFRMERVRELERRWRDDGLVGAESSYLAVVVGG